MHAQVFEQGDAIGGIWLYQDQARCYSHITCHRNFLIKCQLQFRTLYVITDGFLKEITGPSWAG